VGGYQEITLAERRPEPSLKSRRLPGKEKHSLTAEQGRSVTLSTWLHKESTHHQSQEAGHENQS
jgi:hypothetical protein